MGLELWGMDPQSKAIWFGILVLMTVGIGLIAPPVGLNVYVVNQYRVPEGQAAPAARPLRIPCLSGGGYRGLFSAHVLAQIETKLLGSESIASRFDLIAGTSVGGLIACGLAMGKTAQHVEKTLRNSAPSIFPKLRFRTLRKAFPPPYDPSKLRAAVDACAKARQSSIASTNPSWFRQ